MNRKYLSLIICFLFVFTLLMPNSLQAEELGDDPIGWPEIPKENPRLIIARDIWMPEYKAGETVNLSIPVENTSSTSATNVRVSINPGDVDNFPFELDKMSFNKYASSLSGRSVFSYKVTIPSNTKAGTYPINVNVTYDGDRGSAGGSESATVYVKIINDYKQPELKLTGVDLSEDRLPAGQSSLIKLRIQNTGDLNIKSAELKLNGFTSQGFNLDNWSDTQHLRNIKGHETKLVEYRLLVDAKMESGIFPLDLNIKYKDENDREYNLETKVYLPVDGKGVTDDLTPRVIIDNYYFPSEYVGAGQVFPLNISFFNTSENTTVKNIKVSLNADEQIFSPVGSSNSFFIKEIKPRQASENTINLKAKIDAENRNYTISADIEFQDSKGEKYTEKEIISIPVNQQLHLTVSNIEMPPQIFAGTPTSLSIDFYNTGRSLIRNLIIRTEGNFEIQDGTLFIGNLEPGKDNYYDVTIIPHEEGELEGKIIFEYEDGVGEKYSSEESFSLTVMAHEEPPMMDVEMDMDYGHEQGIWKKWGIPIGIGLVILAGGTTLLVIRRRRKKQEEVFFDE